MSLEAVQYVIGRAVTDSGFRGELMRDPEWMLGNVNQRHGYEFTSEEVEAIKAMDWNGLNAVGHDLDQRVSRMRVKSLFGTTCDCVPTPTTD